MAQTFQWVAVGAVVVALAAWGGRRLAKWGMRKFYRWYFTRTIEPAHKPVVSRNALPDASLLGRGRAIVQNLQEIYPEHSFRPWKAVRPTSVKSPGELDSLLRAASDEEVNTSSMEVSGGGTIRIVELNMEMGRHFDAVLRNLVELQPDIVVLTEVDVCVPRSGRINQAAELAIALQMHSYAFVAEVEDPCFKKGVFEGPLGGWQGHAILSRWPICNAVATRLPCQRKGRALESHESYKWHMCLSVAITASISGCRPGPFANQVELAVHGLHLDPNRTTPEGRAAQFRSAWTRVIEPMSRPHLSRSQRQTRDTTRECQTLDESGASSLSESRAVPSTIVAGDFNTLAHVRGRTGKKYRQYCPFVRRNEAAWFDQAVIQQLDVARVGQETNSCQLRDPFNKLHDCTLVSGLTSTCPIFRAKLDWILVDDVCWEVMSKQIGTLPEHQCSDHRWICVDARHR